MNHDLASKSKSLEALLEVVYELRVKCPWDKEQDWSSLRKLTVEELYELIDALDNNSVAEVEKELGDVLLHILFYAMIAEEQKWFDVGTVMDKLRLKLIARHPHVYGEAQIEDAKAVIANWEKLKLKEGSKGVLKGVPESLPNLIKAYRLQEKAATVGFDWDDAKLVMQKVKEELAELEEALEGGTVTEESKEEMGDLLFSIVNLCRKLKIDPDYALGKTNSKFKRRFEWMEEALQADGKYIGDLDLPAMDQYWDAAKAREKQQS